MAEATESRVYVLTTPEAVAAFKAALERSRPSGRLLTTLRMSEEQRLAEIIGPFRDEDLEVILQRGACAEQKGNLTPGGCDRLAAVRRFVGWRDFCRAQEQLGPWPDDEEERRIDDAIRAMDWDTSEAEPW
jgi:hypothetical protein